MANRISRFKPAVRRSTLLLSSACLWTVIGGLLLAKGGYRWVHLADRQPFLLGAALVVGSLKSFFILDKSTRRGISRIQQFADGTCLGAVYSGKTWLLVLCMMGLGVILRNSSFPVALLCFLYLTIGWALLFSSRLAWIAWLKR